MKKQSFVAGVLAVAMSLMMAVTTIAPLTAFAADDTIVYISNTGNRYHREDCRTLSGKSSWAVTTAQARAQGLTACRVCYPDDYFESTVTTTTTVSAPAETATMPSESVTTSTSITPAEAVQQAFALYVQNGLDTNTAFARVQGIATQLAAQPSDFAQIVQNDLAGQTATSTAIAASITPAEAVQQAFALYVQSGLDTNAAFARVQGITAQLAAQPGDFAQIVQNDLAGQTVAATGLTAAQAVQQAFALYVQNGLDTDTAFARVQSITAQLATQPDNYAQFVQADLAAIGK